MSNKRGVIFLGIWWINKRSYYKLCRAGFLASESERWNQNDYSGLLDIVRIISGIWHEEGPLVRVAKSRDAY